MLRHSLTHAPLRKLYTHRAERLLVLSTLAMVAVLLAAAAAPFFLLMLGPMLYGLPHLISSVRYQRLRCQFDRRSWYAGLGLLLLGVASLRGLGLCQSVATAAYAQSFLPIVQEGQNIELAAMLGSMCLVAYRLKLQINWRHVIGFLSFGLFAVLTWAWPLASVGILMLAHHFVAFVYWRLACQTRADRRVVDASLVLFTLVHVLIFAGGLDAWVDRTSGWQDDLFAGFNLADLGSTIVPWSANINLWRRAIVAFAFGQSMHYVLWLRCIPEQHLQRPVAVTFRQSLGLLRRDFGARAAAAMLAACLILGLAWLGAASLGFAALARAAYAAVASGHGYLEIASLFTLVFATAAAQSPAAPK